MQLVSRYIVKKTARAIRLAALLLLFLLSNNDLCAGEQETHRVWVGLDIFPSLLAADLDIAGKKGSDGNLLLVLMYVDKKEIAKEMAHHLKKIETIRDVPVRIELTNDTELKIYKNTSIAGIFLTQRLANNLDSVIRYGKEHHIIVFSPFKGDVENGVSGGIFITDRILSYVNMESIRDSDIRIKSFFLRGAKRYDKKGEG